MSTPIRDDRGRFPKGQSGNASGRKPKDKSVSAAILKAANETIVATQNGKTRLVRKIDATATQFANKGSTGDYRAGRTLLDMAARAEAQLNAGVSAPNTLTTSDAEIAERFLAEYRRFLIESVPA